MDNRAIGIEASSNDKRVTDCKEPMPYKRAILVESTKSTKRTTAKKTPMFP